MSELKTINTLDNEPFKYMVATIGNLPTSFVDSMSYYELLAWLCQYLQQQVIPAVNNNAQAVEELQTLYIELKQYVDNYFENLDVQEEINNKLDDMAEAGTLQEIIGDYLTATAVWGFDSVADMKASTNLISGSYARTLGYYVVNDDGGAMYKITDTEPSSYYETLDSGLYAQLVNGYNVKQYGAYGDDTHDDSTAIQTAIDAKSGVVFPKATYKTTQSILITNKTRWSMNANDATINYTGDSYAFVIRHAEYCNFDFGTVNALSGSCVAFLGDGWQQFSQYNNIRFTELSALTDCIHIEQTGGCWISENRITNGRFHEGVNGIYAMHNSTAGMSHWVIREIGVEGVDNGFNLNVGDVATANERGINQWEISNIRHDESTILFKTRGKVTKFLINAPERMISTKFDLDSGATLWKIVSADRNSYIYDGEFFHHAVDLSDKLTWNQDFNGDESNVSIIPDRVNVQITDNIAMVNISFYASEQIDNIGNNKEFVRGLPIPKKDVYLMGTNYGKDEAMPRFWINTSGKLQSSWSTNKKVYASGTPCIINVSYPISQMEQ